MVEGRKIIQNYVSIILSVQRKNKIACVYIRSWPQYYSITVLFVLLRPGTDVHRLKQKGKKSVSNR